MGIFQDERKKKYHVRATGGVSTLNHFALTPRPRHLSFPPAVALDQSEFFFFCVSDDGGPEAFKAALDAGAGQ